MQDKASLSWTEQQQRVGETRRSSHVVTSRFVETSQGSSQQLHKNVWITKGRNTKYRDSETKSLYCLSYARKCVDHERSKYQITRFRNKESLLFILCIKMCGSRKVEIPNIEIQKQRVSIVYLMHKNVWITKGRNTKYRDSETDTIVYLICVWPCIINVGKVNMESN
jgi:hypothetical protein